MIIRKGLKYRLKTSLAVRRQFAQNAGACRFVWNRILALNERRCLAGIPRLNYYDAWALVAWWKQSEEYGWLKAANAEAKLAFCSLPLRSTTEFRRLPCQRINADAAFDPGERHVRGFPVLVCRRFPEQSFQLIITHPTGTLGRVDASLLHGPGNGLGHTPVNGRCQRTVPAGWRFYRTTQERNDIRSAGRRVFLSQIDSAAGCPHQVTPQTWR
jgi:hypothetical protein